MNVDERAVSFIMNIECLFLMKQYLRNHFESINAEGGK